MIARDHGTRHHGNRHGRSEEARMAVLEAADDLLAERGFAGVTIEGIAVRAQVSKQTIYRWWTSKTDILFDALAEDAAAYFTANDGDDLGADLRHHLRQLAVFLAGTDAGAVCRALAGQAQHDGEVAARFRAEFVAPQRDRDRAPFRRARERGELADDTDLDVAVDQLVGPVYYRVLVTGQPVTSEFTNALVDQYLRSKALFASAPRPFASGLGKALLAGRGRAVYQRPRCTTSSNARRLGFLIGVSGRSAG